MKTSLITAICIAAAVAAQAQDLSTEITVESTVEHALPPASPLPSVFPSLLQPSAPTAKLSTTHTSDAVDFRPSAGASSAVLTTGISDSDTNRGYVWGGYFPAYNLGAGAGYRIVASKTTEVDAAVGFDGYSHHTTAPTGTKGTLTDNTFNAQASASHLFSQGALLKARASYYHSGLKAPDYSGYELGRGIDAYDVSVSASGGTSTTYAAEAVYSHFGFNKEYLQSGYAPGLDILSLPSAGDGHLSADIKLAHNFGDKLRQSAGIDLRADLLHRRGVVGANEGIVSHKGFGRIGVTPSYTVRNDRFYLRAGMRFDIGFNADRGQNFHFAPAAMAAWTPGHRFKAFIRAEGGERLHTQRGFYNYSPFAPLFTASSRSYAPIEGTAGITATPLPSLSLELSAKYGIVHHMPMLVMRTPAYYFADTDLKGWDWAAAIRYSFRKYATISAEAHLYQQGYEKGSSEAPDRAKATVKASVTSRPTDALTLRAAYELRACRRYYTLPYTFNPFGSTPRPVNMGNISDLSVGATYSLTKALDVFLSLENLLCRRDITLPGIATARLHGLAGASFRF